MATHLKSLAKKAKLDEGRAKAARVYKARVASLTSSGLSCGIGCSVWPRRQ